jgi:hypothetical protein
MQHHRLQPQVFPGAALRLHSVENFSAKEEKLPMYQPTVVQQQLEIRHRRRRRRRRRRAGFAVATRHLSGQRFARMNSELMWGSFLRTVFCVALDVEPSAYILSCFMTNVGEV